MLIKYEHLLGFKMQPYVIAPSILAANWAYLGKEVQTSLEGGADWIHCDVMDNHYVANLGFAPPLCKALRESGVQAPIDVHLTTKPVDNLIPLFARAGASSITFYPETTNNIDHTIQVIHDNGLKAGISLSPTTNLSPTTMLKILAKIQSKISLISIMSVHPGFGGQTFIPSVLNKIKTVHKWIENNNPSIRLGVDGGVNLENIQDIADAGADTFAIGTAIFKTNDYAKTIKAFRNKLDNHSRSKY